MGKRHRMTRRVISFTPGTWEAIRALAAERGATGCGLVRRAVERFLLAEARPAGGRRRR